MPSTQQGVSKELRPYAFHGLDLQERTNGQAVGDCPFCGREGKFSVAVDSGKWRCLVCNEGADKGKPIQGGNATTFLRLLWERSAAGDDLEFTKLASNRGLLGVETLSRWGIRRSMITGDWIVPGWTAAGKLSQLYRYVGRPAKLLATAEMGHGLFGADLYDAKKPEVYLCEGPWDAMALWEVLRRTKEGEGGGYEPTGNEDASLYASASVLAVPGVMTFFESWYPLFAGKRLTLMFDSDHPKEHTGGRKTQAGLDGMRRIAEMLSRSTDGQPEEVRYLRWGADGFDPQLPSGFDVRDWLGQAPSHAPGAVTLRVKLLEKLLAKVAPIPDAWVPRRSRDSPKQASGSVEMDLLPCDSWGKLENSCRKAMKWTEGLDRGMSVGLAAILGTGSVGSQLWIRLIGPASCISGDTQVTYVVRDKKTGRIINKKGGPLKRLYERFNNLEQRTGGSKQVNTGVDFFVQSMKDDGWVFRNKIEGVLFNGVKKVYEVTTKSGYSLKATGDHEIMTSEGYRRADSLVAGDFVMVNPGVTKPSGRTPTPYRKEVFVKSHPTAKSKTVNGCHYKRLRVYQAIYEAHMNSLSYDDYVVLLNKGCEGISLWTIPEGYDIHHKDENPNNNSVDNLEMVLNTEHGKLHGSGSTKHIAIYAEPDEVVSIEKTGEEEVFDIVCTDPYRNFVAGGVIVHNCGKSTLCEAWSTNKTHVKALSTIRGFHSGYKEGDGSKNNSLVLKLKGKTLVTKDADSMISGPNWPQIMGEARDLFDRTARTDYRTGMGLDHEAINMTWILCGTSALRQSDMSELGARFVDCVIMEGIDEELEHEVNLRVAHRALRNVGIRSNGKMTTQLDPAMVEMMQLTGGYISYLHDNAEELIAQVEVDDDLVHQVINMAVFVAYMRARPSVKQQETTEREFSARLVEQFCRLTLCLTVVLSKRRVDAEVLRRVVRCAMDTSRGRTMQIARYLHEAGDEGLELRALAVLTNQNDQEERKLLQFLRKIGAVELWNDKEHGNRKAWRLTKRLGRLYAEVTSYA